LLTSVSGMISTKNGVGRLNGCVCLITGGTSGIGKATAFIYAKEGARVIITGRRKSLGDQVVMEIQSLVSDATSAFFIEADHTKVKDCELVVESALEKFGRIDVLFNNAGIVPCGTAEETSEDTWKNVLDINVTAVWRMSKLVLPTMRKQRKGVIVNNASDWGIVGGRSAAAYCMSKGAVIQLTKAMALDHAREGIRINAVCPGDTYVERWQVGGYYGSSSVTLDVANSIAENDIPIGRVAIPDEIAKAVLFLSCDDSSYMTGSTLVVDGGNVAR
jgi:meso-butanediol dehydrogenase/(S,S)-butanediol dehydrogenase/diacetyl reductase